jgi:hypothetical protein
MDVFYVINNFLLMHIRLFLFFHIQYTFEFFPYLGYIPGQRITELHKILEFYCKIPSGELMSTCILTRRIKVKYMDNALWGRFCTSMGAIQGNLLP